MARKLIFALILLCVTFPLHCRAQELEEKALQDAGLRERLGDFLFQSGNCHDAMLEWEKSIRLDPGRASCFLKLGNLYYAGDLPEKSLFYFSRAAALAPDDSFSRYNYGLALLTCGHAQEAFNEFAEVVRLSPDREYTLYPHIRSTSQSLQFSYTVSPAARAHFFLGFIYRQRGDYRHAVYELAHSFLPATPFGAARSPAQRACAFLDLMAGTPVYTGSALDVNANADNFIGLKDRDGKALFSRSVSFTLSKNGELVTPEGYGTAIKVPPHMIDIFIGNDGVVYGGVMSRETVKKAPIKALGKLECAAFDNPQNLAVGGPGILRETPTSGRRPARGVVLAPGFRRLPALQPGDELGCELITACGLELVKDQALAGAWENFGESDEIALYEEALENENAPVSRIEALSCVATLYFRNSEVQKAEQALLEAMKMQPENWFLHFNLGYLYMSSQNPRGARSEFESALKKSGELSASPHFDQMKARTLLCKGITHLMLDEQDQAFRCLKASLGRDPETCIEAYLPLSEIFWKRGQKGQALIYLFEFLQGSVIPRPGSLSAAILGEGFFEVQAPGGGKKACYREGIFTMNARGEIVTPEGYTTGLQIPDGMTDLTLTAGGLVLGITRDGKKREAGRLKVVSPGPAPAKNRNYYAGPVGAGIQQQAYLAPGFACRQGFYVEEYRAWQDLARYIGDRADIRSLINDALMGKWKDVAARARNNETPGEEGDLIRYLLCKSYIAGGNLGQALGELESIKGGDNEIVISLKETIITHNEGGVPPGQTFSDAGRILEALTASGPGNGPAQFLLAWLYDVQGQEGKAIEEYTRFLKIGSDTGELPLELHLLFNRIFGKSDFTLLETLMPGHPGYLEQGFSLSAETPSSDDLNMSWKSLEKAVPGFAEIDRKSTPIHELKKEEKILYAHYRIGVLREKAGDQKGALKAYRKYIQLRGFLNPHLSSFIFRDIIRAYFNAGLLDEARNELDLMKYEYRFYNSSLANLFIMLGRSYEQKGERGKARECYLEAKKIQDRLGIKEQPKGSGN